MVNRNSTFEEIKAEAYRKDGMEVRMKVLQTGLHLESIVNEMLIELLGIEKGKALPFTQYGLKIRLLLLIGAINAKTDFDVFGDIRNQFIHNVKANTLEKCLEITGHKESIRSYGKESMISCDIDPSVVPESELLRHGLDELCTRVIIRARGIREHANDRNYEQTAGRLAQTVLVRLQPLLFKPFGNAQQRMDEGPDMRAKAEIKVLLSEVALEIKDSFLDLVDEVVLEDINRGRTKEGLEPLDSIPESEISRKAKAMGHE